jgi:hypothetical protein
MNVLFHILEYTEELNTNTTTESTDGQCGRESSSSSSFSALAAAPEKVQKHRQRCLHKFVNQKLSKRQTKPTTLYTTMNKTVLTKELLIFPSNPKFPEPPCIED